MALTQVKTLGIADDAVTLAKQAGGTDGNLITYNASGDPAAVAAGNDGQVLTSQGAGSVPQFETLPTIPTVSGSTNNTICTVTGANAIQGEANLTYDGTKLLVGGTTLSSSNERTLQVHSVDGPKIAIGRNDTSISDGNTIGGLEFYGNDADGTFVNTASIIVNADGTHDNNDKPTRMQFYTTADGGSSSTERLRIDSSGLVGIGLDSPSSYSSGGNNLVVNDASGAGGITIVTPSTAEGSIFFSDGTGGTAQGRIRYDHNYDTLQMGANGSDTHLRIYSNGYVTTNKTKEAFWYKTPSNTSSSSATSNDEVLIFSQALESNSGLYNTSNGRYTAPVAGVYFFFFNGLIDNNASTGSKLANLYKNGSNKNTICFTNFSGSDYMGMSGSAVVNLAENDYVQIYAKAGMHTAGETNFGGYLVG